MPGEPIFESRIAGDGDDQVVPTIQRSELQLVVQRRAGLEKPARLCLASVGIEHADLSGSGGEIGDLPHDEAAALGFIRGDYIQNRCGGADAAVEIADEAIRTV